MARESMEYPGGGVGMRSRGLGNRFCETSGPFWVGRGSHRGKPILATVEGHTEGQEFSLGFWVISRRYAVHFEILDTAARDDGLQMSIDDVYG